MTRLAKVRDNRTSHEHLFHLLPFESVVRNTSLDLVIQNVFSVQVSFEIMFAMMAISCKFIGNNEQSPSFSNYPLLQFLFSKSNHRWSALITKLMMAENKKTSKMTLSELRAGQEKFVQRTWMTSEICFRFFPKSSSWSVLGEWTLIFSPVINRQLSFPLLMYLHSLDFLQWSCPERTKEHQ